MQQEATISPSQQRRAMALACGGFFALGVVTSALGPALPEFADRTGASLAALGGLFTAFFVGALLAQIICGPLVDRIGQRPVLAAGLALTAIGYGALASSGLLALTFGATAVAGFGFGAVGISTNLLVAGIFATRSAAALNLVNVFFGLGAFIGPLIAGVTLRVWATALPPMWLGALLLLGLAPAVALLAPPIRPAAPARTSAAGAHRSLPLWIIAAMLLIAVGVEAGMGGWTSAYVERTTAFGPAAAALVTSAFWLALTGGRLIGTLVGVRRPPATLLLGALVGALAGATLLVASTGNAPLTIAAVVLLGLSCGPIYPTALALITTTFRSAAGAATSIVSAVGSVGGMLIPWFQGVLLEQSGPRPSVLLLAVGALGMLALHLAYGYAANHKRRPLGRGELHDATP